VFFAEKAPFSGQMWLARPLPVLAPAPQKGGDSTPQSLWNGCGATRWPLAGWSIRLN
jgi:hypothetical protein